MSRHRNGNRNRIGKGNAVLERVWNLKKDGILWKKVTEYSPMRSRSWPAVSPRNCKIP